MTKTAPAPDSNPFAAALALQTQWWAQTLRWNTAWWDSVAEWQRQALEQDWTAPAPWLRWLTWHNGTEQLG